MQIKVSDVVFREDLYPRIKTDPATVQKYAEDISVLPPIEVNQHNELIDGWHRWTAHRKVGEDSIMVIVTETTSDSHLLELAIERNAAHGLQLSQEDKRNMARRIYHVTPEQDRAEKKKQLAQILSVSQRTVQTWLSRIDKDAKESRNKRIFDLWMQCYTQEEIAEICGCDRNEVKRFLSDDVGQNGKFADLTKNPAANHLTDFEPPIYNVWKQQEKTSGVNHFGNSEVKWLDNLLYLYTKPYDIVIDPFAGSGSTIDICKKRFRRYWVSDRAPIVERESEIRKHDICDGLPAVPRWKDVSLVYLDPPYWWQAKGKYSKDAKDLANMELDIFTRVLAGLITDFARKLKNDDSKHIALIIQPTQWNAPDRQFTDHLGDLLRIINLPVVMRFSVPYESQQCNAQMVEWAKSNKQCLVLTREIVVWRVGQ